jgi:dihydrolipoamide dehydrogenase
MADYDLIVIGGGPAGYVGAIRAAQLGKKVACVERDRAGGTCLNWGCIPTKALLKNAELYHTLKHRAAEFGIGVEGLSYDWKKVIGRSRGVADKLAGGIEFLFKNKGVDYLRGEARLAEGRTVVVKDAGGEEKSYVAGKILIATGCKPRELPFLPFDGKQVISSKEAMALDKQPASMIIIGAGAIGVEFASFYHAFGTEVTVVEMMDHLVPVEDVDVSVALEKSFKKDGIRVMVGTKTVSAEVKGGKAAKVELKVEPAAGGEVQELGAEVCLVAVGVAPVLPEGGERLRLTESGYLDTDAHYMTSEHGIYAAGDIVGPPWLAHTASYEAIQAVNGMFVKGFAPKRVDVFPGCTYCHPQIASVGLTEAAAKDKGIKYKVGQFPFSASGRALAVAEPGGFVKILIGEEHGEILGAHIIGDNATELIAELGLAITAELTYEEIEATIHAHPTMSEAVHEAVAKALGHPIHIP